MKKIEIEFTKLHTTITLISESENLPIDIRDELHKIVEDCENEIYSILKKGDNNINK